MLLSLQIFWCEDQNRGKYSNLTGTQNVDMRRCVCVRVRVCFCSWLHRCNDMLINTLINTLVTKFVLKRGVQRRRELRHASLTRCLEFSVNTRHDTPCWRDEEEVEGRGGPSSNPMSVIFLKTSAVSLTTLL